MEREEIIETLLVGGLDQLVLVSGTVYEYEATIIGIPVTGISNRGSELKSRLHRVFILAYRGRGSHISVLHGCLGELMHLRVGG